MTSARRPSASSGRDRSRGASSTGRGSQRVDARHVLRREAAVRLGERRPRPRRADHHRRRRRVRAGRRSRRTRRAGEAVPADVGYDILPFLAYPRQPGAGHRRGQRHLPGRRVAHRDAVRHRGGERSGDLPCARAAARHPRRHLRRGVVRPCRCRGRPRPAVLGAAVRRGRGPAPRGDLARRPARRAPRRGTGSGHADPAEPRPRPACT